jgi:hypothetical protein
VKAPASCRLIGRWRIVEADLEVEYARDSIGFHWAGCEEGDEADGEGTAELLNDCSIEIEFEYRNGDEAVLKAKPDTSSSLLATIRGHRHVKHDVAACDPELCLGRDWRFWVDRWNYHRLVNGLRGSSLLGEDTKKRA